MEKGFGSELRNGKTKRKHDLNFFKKILWTIRESNTDIKLLNRLLQDNLHRLDNNFLAVLRDWVTVNLPKTEPDKAYNKALAIREFSKIIQELPELEPVRRVIYVEIAIVGYEFALRVLTQELFSQIIAEINYDLGNAYCDRIHGDSVQNLEQAITAFNAALQVYTRENFPEEWAGLQNNLGNAYRELFEGNREENLERSIFHFKDALKVYKRENFPEDWAMVQNNLALTYCELNQINQAIICYLIQRSSVFTPPTATPIFL
jgi:tetratricopeptide (TPR) repeat protein